MMSLAELKNHAMSFDTATEKEVIVDNELVTRYKAIYNNERNRISSIVSSDYNLVQHRHVITSVVDALLTLGIKSDARVRSSGDVVFVDIAFSDSKLYVRPGEEFVAGVRIVNSYNKSTGIIIQPRLKRLVCKNGMVMANGWVKDFNIRHTQKLAEDLKHQITSMMQEMITGNEKLKALVNNCIQDSVEWETMKVIIKRLVRRQKHADRILQILRDTESNEYSRWDLYNAVTNYATHDVQVTPLIEQRLQNLSKRIMTTPLCEFFG